MPTIGGMKGSGFYDRNSGGQRASIETVLPWVDAAAAAVPLPAGSDPVTIVDYGCSEGRNSILVANRIADCLRRRNAAQSVRPIFADVPTNNFNQLFRNLEDDGRLTRRDDGFFPSAVAGSFYDLLLPKGSVHLATTFNAICWLDSLPPVELRPEFVIYLGPRPHRPEVTVAPETVAAFGTQARRDLVRFLECRAAELVPEGRLLMATPARDGEHAAGEGIYDVVHDACIDLMNQGRIDGAAYRRITMPVYFRTLDEILSPVDSVNGPLAESFRVERAEVERVAPPFATNYEQTGDMTRYVDEYVGFVQAFTEPILRDGLESSHDPGLFAAIYDRAKERLRATPDRYVFRYIQATTLLARR
ncbi:MAG: cyclopropane-fatty-acyl-phospholipid synthase [Planctomycetia bacterium]|nr:cyclopropane-fatty-acyl-phospholipid synthase [Planctomycetia bacterium]